jgi:Subtilase family
MCTHVPGECLAIAKGSREALAKQLYEWDIPGHWEILPLLAEGHDYPTDQAQPFKDHHFIHVVDIPEGLELLVISKLSAALHGLVERGHAVVELHLSLPLSAQPARRARDGLTSRGQFIAERLRRYVGGLPMPANTRRPLGLLDTGISTTSLRVRPRKRITRDYAGGGSTFGAIVNTDHDLQGHGTQVFRILDESLPDDVPVVSGRIAAESDTGITVLRVSTAFAHMVAMDDPAVVNLSLAPRDDNVICPHCRRAIPVEAFHSLILPYVFRVAKDRTLTIMAAGNHGQIANARHALAAAGSLTLVEASDSSGELAAYSNKVDEEFATVARAFGGDGDDAEHSQQMFNGIRDSFGTSFAAPFVSAAAYAWRMKHGSNLALSGVAPSGVDFSAFCRYEIKVPIDFRSGAAPRPQAPIGSGPLPGS